MFLKYNVFIEIYAELSIKKKTFKQNSEVTL